MTDICYPNTNALPSVATAQAQILAAIDPITDQERLPLTAGLGRVLAKTLHASIAIPPQNNSAMDGYGFAGSDLNPHASVRLTIVGCAWAGKPFTGPIQAGECIRIFTGAVVPDGIDSVIAQELVSVDANQIQLAADTQAYKNIRKAGSDIQPEQVLLTAGKTISATDLALLAAAGITTVPVIRQLRIGFFSTGDELKPLGTSLELGQIYDSNRYQLIGLLNNPLYQLTDLGIVNDDPATLDQTLITAATQQDLLISTGGASVGEADYIQQSLNRCGQVNFWKIAIKPGKPLAFGKIGNCYFFGLPGNPVAVLVTYEKFVKPALNKLAGALPKQTMQIKAISQDRLRKQVGRQEYQRGILSCSDNGEWQVALAGGQDSHQLSSASKANCFIVLSHDCQGVEIGEIVLVEPFQTEF